MNTNTELEFGYCKCCGRKMDNEKALTQSEDDRYYLICMNPECVAFVIEQPY